MTLVVRRRRSASAPRLGLALAAVLALGSGPALGQTPTEPDHPQAAPPSPQPAMQATLTAPAGAPVAPPPAPDAAAPNPQVDQTGVSRDDPPDAADLAYEGRIRQSVAAAEAYQGPMDGRWTLYGDDGKALYVFMFVDPAGGRGALEAAWRDPRRVRGGDDLGVVDIVGRAGPELTLAFTPREGAAAIRIELQSGVDGGFSGHMDEAGAVRMVKLRRD